MAACVGQRHHPTVAHHLLHAEDDAKAASADQQNVGPCDSNAVTVHLRSYEPADAQPTRRVFQDAIRGTAAEHYSPDQIEAWCPTEYDEAERGRARGRAWTVVAELDEEVIGFLRPHG